MHLGKSKSPPLFNILSIVCAIKGQDANALAHFFKSIFALFLFLLITIPARHSDPDARKVLSHMFDRHDVDQRKGLELD